MKISILIISICPFLVGFINLRKYKSFIKRQKNNVSVSNVRFIYIYGTIFSIFMGTMIWYFVCELLMTKNEFINIPIINLIMNLPVIKQLIYLIIIVLFYEIIFDIYIIIGNFITDNSLYCDFKTTKPDYEKVFNRITLFLSIFIMALFILPFTRDHSDYDNYNMIYTFEMFVGIPYLFFIVRLIKSKSIKMDWAEFSSVIFKSLLKAIVVLASLGTLVDFAAGLKASSAILTLIIDIWSYIHDLLKKQNKHSNT